MKCAVLNTIRISQNFFIFDMSEIYIIRIARIMLMAECAFIEEKRRYHKSKCVHHMAG